MQRFKPWNKDYLKPINHLMLKKIRNQKYTEQQNNGSICIRLNVYKWFQVNAHLEKIQLREPIIMTGHQAGETKGTHCNINDTNYATFVSSKLSVYIRAYYHTLWMINYSIKYNKFPNWHVKSKSEIMATSQNEGLKWEVLQTDLSKCSCSAFWDAICNDSFS